MPKDSALDRAKAEVAEEIGGRTLEERAMAEDESVPTELWTPPEKLSSNVGRMAWAMFLKLWKDGGKYEQEEDESDSEARQGAISLWAHDYRYCIDVAKALEEINQDPSQ